MSHAQDSGTEAPGPVHDVLIASAEMWERTVGWMTGAGAGAVAGVVAVDGAERDLTAEPGTSAASDGGAGADAAAGVVAVDGAGPDSTAEPGTSAASDGGVGAGAVAGVVAVDGAGPDSTAEPGTSATSDGGASEGVIAAGGDCQGSSTDLKEESPRYNKAIVVGFVAATVVVSLVVGALLLAMRRSPHTADQEHPAHPSTQVSIVAAPTTSAVVGAGGQDAPIPYTATAVGCLPGSTAAQSVAGTDPTQAWVCVHGGTVGQYLVLNLGHTMVITGVSVTPGWVGADAAGADQWLQHRVVQRLQWSFNDSPPTVVPQETRSVHGDAPQAMPGRGVLASRIILLIQETGRAPAETSPSSTPNPAPGGLFDDVLGPPAIESSASPTSTAVLPGLPADQSRTDPADNTFAVSSIKIFGHPPQ